MATAAEMLAQGLHEEVWQKYCGFLDLSVDGFMRIQERLLMEQISLLGQCKMGQELMGGYIPRSMEDFRKNVPLTTHHHYMPYFLQNPQVEPGVLPGEPIDWARTSGRSSEFGFKWAPYTREMKRKVGEFVVTCFLLASCKYKGDVRLEPGDVTLFTLAPAPFYTGGVLARGFQDELNPMFIPPLDVGDKMEFEERIQTGFKMGMKHGIDLFYGLSSVLVGIGEQFQHKSGKMKFSMDMLHPQILARLIKGKIRSALQHRPMLPKDLWDVKGIAAGGMDTAFFADKIEEYWGIKPMEGYGGTESGGIAVQTWTHKAMTFVPDINFLEFIPEADFYRNMEDPSFVPSTRTIAELTPGVYEVVITNFHGNAFVRYRLGDLVKVTALEDPELKIALPQMVFHARGDGIIDISGFTRITEKSMLLALESTGIPTVGWTARKEIKGGQPIVHLYVESVNGYKAEDFHKPVQNKLREEDPGFAELEQMLGTNPLQVTMLPNGAFTRYIQMKRQQGADLAHLKPQRINAKDEVIKLLMNDN